MPTIKYNEKLPEDVDERISKYGLKFYWFLEKGYVPHIWQLYFHSFTMEERLCRFRHLVAGRRGGKTLSAAWELLFYTIFPTQFHADAHGIEEDRPLWAWVLTKDYPLGRPALLTFREVLNQAGLRHGVDYKENRGQRFFEFENGSLIEFKTADNPQSLRGAGLDLLWVDEAAMIPSEEAYDVVYPALADKEGIVITTTTPQGKNWFFNRFWSEDAKENPNIGRVEYRSIDNPHFPRSQWEVYRQNYHPMLFEQEFMASFESMAGRELSGDWLHYYETSELPDNLDYFMGVDPAVSLSEQADYFAMVLIGVDRKAGKTYLVDLYKDRIPFPEQVEKIVDWYQLYRPLVIGVEQVAYQAALGQQVTRLTTFAPIAEIRANRNKPSRILGMSPLFRLGKIKIRKDQQDFIKEWVDYDSTLGNPQDDCLDATEIAIRAAGALLPVKGPNIKIDRSYAAQFDVDAAAQLDRERLAQPTRRVVDTYLGGEW